ncbi:MAG: VOC family protein [Magnetococcales bacterium]|nr:VOC family protein [Magnetococcales bacterium]
MNNDYTGIHHAAFATRDITRTVHFWRDLLGLRLVYSYGRPGYRQYFFQISGSNRISFFEWPEVEGIPYRRHGEPVKGPLVFDHIAIGVVDVKRLWEIMARLDAAGFPVSDMVDHGAFLSIYSYDPNGIPIEFSCDAEGTNLWDDPVIRDQSAPAWDLGIPEPRPGLWPKADPIAEEDRVIVPGEGKEYFPRSWPVGPDQQQDD